MSAPLDHAPIRARVGNGAIDKVTRLFNASLPDACVELLQNARRAGATRIMVNTEPLGGATRVTIIDDGAGIADPQVLLSFGDSDWKAGIAKAEDPAGMGLLSLSRRGCTVRWRALDEYDSPGPGYRLVLNPDHFLGRESAQVELDDEAPGPHGTSVSFDTDREQHSVQFILEAAARHYPLPVTLDGEVIRRRAFLDGALHAERWRGLVFGAYRGCHTGYRVPDVNFHGLTLPVRLPQVDTVAGASWTVRADIEACPELELVLPARKEAVETPFLDQMRDAARLAVYRTMAQAEPAPRVAHKDWKRAAAAGIDLPVPFPELRPWRPAVADVDDWRETADYAPVGTGVPEPGPGQALVVTADLDPPEAQTLYRAARRAGIDARLFEAEPRFTGFDWYDRLPRVEAVAVRVIVDGATRALDSFRDLTGDAQDVRPDAVHMDLHIALPPTSDRNASAMSETLTIGADVVFAGDAWCWLDDTHPLVPQTADPAPDELAALIVDAYFCASDDADADSYQTQRSRYEADALHLAMKLLASNDDAIRRSIADAIWQEVLWRFPRDRDVEVHVRGKQIDVTLGPPPAPPHTEASVVS